MKENHINEIMHERPMTPMQITAVAICLFVNMLDGFDVMAIAFAAPEIAADWNVSAASLGVLFSAGLGGMVLGSLFLAPLADRFGRRIVILASTVVITIGMLGSGAAVDLNQLLALRLLTGLGVGAMLPSLNTMVAEYSPARRRKLMISILQAGYPVGAILAGLLSAVLIAAFDWRAIFYAGGILSLITLPIVYFGLPESLDNLLARRPANALRQVNALLRRLGQPAIDELPPVQPGKEPERNTVRTLFTSRYIGRTIGLWISFFVLMSVWYFVINWTPKILVDAGLSAQAGISGGVLMSVGGVFGGLALGVLASFFATQRIIAAFMLLAMVAMISFGSAGTVLGILLMITFMIGFFLAGSIVGLYSLMPEIYPVEIRNAGTGWAIGIGRLGSVAGPYVAGLLIAAGFERLMYFSVLALPLLLSMIAMLRAAAAASNPQPAR